MRMRDAARNSFPCMRPRATIAVIANSKRIVWMGLAMRRSFSVLGVLGARVAMKGAGHRRLRRHSMRFVRRDSLHFSFAPLYTRLLSLYCFIRPGHPRRVVRNANV